MIVGELHIFQKNTFQRMLTGQSSAQNARKFLVTRKKTVLPRMSILSRMVREYTCAQMRQVESVTVVMLFVDGVLWVNCPPRDPDRGKNVFPTEVDNGGLSFGFCMP